MLHQNIVRQNKFFNFSPNFLHSFMLIWLFQDQLHFRLYLQSCKLVIAFKAIEFWCIVGLTAVLCLLQRKNSTFL